MNATGNNNVIMFLKCDNLPTPRLKYIKCIFRMQKYLEHCKGRKWEVFLGTLSLYSELLLTGGRGKGRNPDVFLISLSVYDSYYLGRWRDGYPDVFLGSLSAYSHISFLADHNSFQLCSRNWVTGTIFRGLVRLISPRGIFFPEIMYFLVGYSLSFSASLLFSLSLSS